uniref:Uncharacterized protein n=1 Tax=Arundo donax TaxID=35708 RepID=A0A0A8XYQ4_ARUDO
MVPMFFSTRCNQAIEVLLAWSDFLEKTLKLCTPYH